MDRKCTVSGCETPARSGRSPYCEKHYYRVRRNGTTETVQKRIPDKPCFVEGCEKPAEHVDGLCRMHKLRMKIRGDYYVENSGENNHRWLSDDELTYRAMHQRVRAARGSATAHTCVRCGRPAKQWAYDHADPDERLVEYQDLLVPISTKTDHYQPMCVSCHKRMDMTHINEQEQDERRARQAGHEEGTP